MKKDKINKLRELAVITLDEYKAKENATDTEKKLYHMAFFIVRLCDELTKCKKRYATLVRALNDMRNRMNRTRERTEHAKDTVE